MIEVVSHNDLINTWRALVDDACTTATLQHVTPESPLYASVHYVLASGGKRLRSLLMLSLFSDITLGKGEVSSSDLINVAVAVELLHAASLIHDDLPSMDDDDFRRGRPACHKQFNEATAVLTGDLLIGLAFHNVAGCGLSSDLAVAATRHLSGAWAQLCTGQAIDIMEGGQGPRREEMIALKTGALFGCATALGAVMARTDAKVVSKCLVWGTEVGSLFQELDDIADGESTMSKGALEARIKKIRKQGSDLVILAGGCEEDSGQGIIPDILNLILGEG